MMELMSAARPDWDDFRIFLAVADLGSIAQAARALGMDTSTVSRRITRLEETLGVMLFQRNPGGMMLSEPGQRLHERIVAAEQHLRLGVDEATGATDEDPRGTVRLASPIEIGARVLVPLVHAFSREYPRVSVDLVVGRQLADLDRREVDIAMRLVRPQTGDLVAISFGTYRFCAYAAPRLLADLGHQDPARIPWLGWSEELERPEDAWLARHVPGAQVVMRSNEMTVIYAACMAGVGAAVLPNALAELENLTEISLGTAPAPSQSVWLVASASVLDLPHVRALWNFLKRKAAEIDEKRPG